MKKILYISSNDGSDMRITKEIKTLSKFAKIIFIGVKGEGDCYVRPYCDEIYLINGSRKNPFTIIKQFCTSLYLMIFKRIHSIHIINEQLMVFFYPLLFFKHTVLDLFDSIFLKRNYPGSKLTFLKHVVYAPANIIIVTDDNRYNLMAETLKDKCIVVANYPNRIVSIPPKGIDRPLTLMYNGWMGLGRGTEIVEGLLNTNLPIKILMAGWFSDEYTKNLVKQFPEKIEFSGVIPQRKALFLAAERADYILCVYAPLNTNNINASPNKVFDAILIDTPLIINKEVKLSQWVIANNLGIVIEQYNISNYEEFYYQLVSNRGKYYFSNDFKQQYVWESIEGIVLKAHKLTK